MLISIPTLRNLTTGRLHTSMQEIYKTIEAITETDGVMTHQLPNASDALKPWLREKVPDPRFWDGAHDPTHVGTIELPDMTPEERKAFWDRYTALPRLFS